MTQPCIASRQNPLCKLVRSLHTPKGRNQHRLFLAEGRNAVEAAIATGWPLRKLLCAEDEVLSWAAKSGTSEVQAIAPAILEYLSDAQTSTEVLALCEFPASCNELQFENLWMVLDGVSDPGNVGTLIRAADAAGAGGVLLTSSSADAFSPKAVRKCGQHISFAASWTKRLFAARG